MKQREDIERKERVARLAQQNLLLASLPPRMAKHEKEKREQELRNQINEKNMERQQDKKTFVANEVPNFDRLHRQFQELLDRKRSNKRPTEAKPFNFQESKVISRILIRQLTFKNRKELQENTLMWRMFTRKLQKMRQNEIPLSQFVS